MKGIIFTLDAIIAFGIIIAIISGLTFFRTEIVSSFLTAQRLHSVSEDILNVLYNSKLRDVTNQTRLNEYLADKTLEAADLDKKPADVIGALWANVSKRDQAANISKDILENFIPYNIGYQIMIDNDDVYNSSDTTRPYYENASTRISSGRIISGYEKYKPVSGFVARAWATKIKRTIIKTIPINLEWGSYTENLGAANRYWYNGYAPSATVANRWAEIRKNFTLPTDANISYAYMQMAFDTDYANITINGNQVFYGSSLAGQIREFNITNNIVPGLNTINITFRRTDIDLGHFHPGCYIKMKYNTSEIESGSNETVFSADWIRGAPSANEIIPFYVNMPIKNVTAYVEVKDINAFLLLTLNYKYNFSNPLRNVLLYRIYPQPVDCGSLSQTQCQSNPQCSWNATSPRNVTVFSDGFEVDITTNWTVSPSGIWTWVNDQQHSGSRSGKKGTSTAAGNLTSRSVNTSDAIAIYVDFWYRRSNTVANDVNLQYNNSSGQWNTIADLSTGSGWNNYASKITDSQYSHNGFAIRFRGSIFSNQKSFWVDDLTITKTVNGKCENTGGEDVKNRSYELFFNDTGTLINERNDAGSLLNTWFNTNVTINNVYNNMTNTLGIYADIRPPNNSTVIGHEPDKDWQYLGMFANNGTAGHTNDYYCYITEKSNVTLYHDKERYGIEYGKIDITTVENFTTNEKNCTTKNNVSSCKDAVLNLTFPFTTNIFKARVVGTQSWGGNDNGYNFIWTWVNDSEPVEAHLVMDTDTPPGTFSYTPVQFFQTNKINIIRVGDKDSGRYLNTTISALMRNRLSIIEYSFLIPSQVPYGKIFENETDAINDAETRLNQILGSLASATVISKESFRVGGVPFMYGPFSFRVNVWV